MKLVAIRDGIAQGVNTKREVVKRLPQYLCGRHDTYKPTQSGIPKKGCSYVGLVRGTVYTLLPFVSGIQIISVETLLRQSLGAEVRASGVAQAHRVFNIFVLMTTAGDIDLDGDALV
jgi:hypothetical protein